MLQRSTRRSYAAAGSFGIPGTRSDAPRGRETEPVAGKSSLESPGQFVGDGVFVRTPPVAMSTIDTVSSTLTRGAFPAVVVKFAVMSVDPAPVRTRVGE